MDAFVALAGERPGDLAGERAGDLLGVERPLVGEAVGEGGGVLTRLASFSRNLELCLVGVAGVTELRVTERRPGFFFEDT